MATSEDGPHKGRAYWITEVEVNETEVELTGQSDAGDDFVWRLDYTEGNGGCLSLRGIETIVDDFVGMPMLYVDGFWKVGAPEEVAEAPLGGGGDSNGDE